MFNKKFRNHLFLILIKVRAVINPEHIFSKKRLDEENFSKLTIIPNLFNAKYYWWRGIQFQIFLFPGMKLKHQMIWCNTGNSELSELDLTNINDFIDIVFNEQWALSVWQVTMILLILFSMSNEHWVFDKHQWCYWYCFQWALSNEYLTSISDLIDIVFNDWLRFKLFSLKKMNRREFYTCRRASCHISHSECGEKFSLVIQSSLPPKRSFSTKYWISLGPVWTTDFQNMNIEWRDFHNSHNPLTMTQKHDITCRKIFTNLCNQIV